jgi:hypothetical protein
MGLRVMTLLTEYAVPIFSRYRDVITVQYWGLPIRIRYGWTRLLSRLRPRNDYLGRLFRVSVDKGMCLYHFG